jgi:hypothetical protein
VTERGVEEWWVLGVRRCDQFGRRNPDRLFSVATPPHVTSIPFF